MKNLFLFCFAMLFGVCVTAQNIGRIPDKLKNLSAKRPVHLSADNQTDMSTGNSPLVYAHPGKSINEVEIGTTRYDLQTNQAVQNRIYLFPDNTVGATWTYGTNEPAYANRGTGYNYYDLTSWGPEPTVRIENARCGWPSYMPLPGGGELVITHNGSTGLLVSSRAVKGSGAWTTTTLIGPVTSGGTTALIWPRAIASGNTIHLISCTDQPLSGPPFYSYQGLSLALVYYKSTDGGASWSAPMILPGMDSSAATVHLPNNAGFQADSYSWAAPKGDTIAFVVGDSWSDLFAMKSFDGGTNWTKIMIYDFPDLPTAPTPIVATSDASVAIAIDDSGKVHVAFGKMRVSDDSYTDDPPQSSYYPYTDGLIYWNEYMNPLDSGILNNDSLLNLNGNLIAGMLDYNGDLTINFPSVGTGQWPFGTYYLSLTSMPQMIIEGNDIYVTYSCCREDKSNTGASPNEQLYRHLYAMRSADLGLTWPYTTDITGDAIHDFDECVFGSLSYTTNDSLYIVYQADEEPGLAIRGDEDGNTTNRIYCKIVPKDSLPVGIREGKTHNSDAVVFPNPATDHAQLNLNLGRSEDVRVSMVNMLGQTVFSKGYGRLIAGKNSMDIDVRRYTAGMYFINIQTGSTRITRKLMIR